MCICVLCVPKGLDIPIYEEVEAYTGMRPVLVFGALSDQVVASLLESYDNMFYSCNTGEWKELHRNSLPGDNLVGHTWEALKIVMTDHLV